MEATRIVDGKKRVVLFAERSGLPAPKTPFEEQRELIEAQQRHLPGAATAAEIGMSRAAVEKAARQLQDSRAAWRLFEAQLYGGNRKALDPVLSSHLGVR